MSYVIRELVLKLLDTPVVWFELFVEVLAAPLLLWCSVSDLLSSEIRRVVAVLAAIAQVGVVLIEGAHWRLVPIELLAVGLVCLIFWSPPLARRHLSIIVVCGWGLLIVSVGASLMRPPIATPKPTGQFEIGTSVLYLVDKDRHENLNATRDGPRELMVQIWYPIDREDKSEVSTIGPANFIKSHALRTKAYAMDAPLSRAQLMYPVLMFSPSWHGQRGQNSFQVDELVSHGFVVVGIDHPYSSAITVFPDGRVARAQLSDFVNLSSDEALRVSFRRNEEILRTRVQDVEFVVQQLKQLDRSKSGGALSGRLDFGRLGVFGYSFGGAVAAQTCWIDQQFKAGLDLDGTLFGDVAEAGVEQPFAFVVEKTEPPTLKKSAVMDPEKRRYVWLGQRDFEEQRNSMRKHGGYWLGISGTQHVNFTDPPTWPTIGYYLDEAGTIDPVRAMSIINAYTLAFFEKHLNRRSEKLLDGPSRTYPEVNVAWPDSEPTEGNRGANWRS
jgi:hypothetical protein